MCNIINDICLIKLYTPLQRIDHLFFILFHKKIVIFSGVEWSGDTKSFFKYKKIQRLLPLPFWVSCSPVLGKTNRITHCEWLRTELHYQSSAWLCTNSVGHSGHFAAYEYFRQEESLKASWWINTRKEDVFMFYSYLLKHYSHYYTPMKSCLFKQKEVAL